MCIVPRDLTGMSFGIHLNGYSSSRAISFNPANNNTVKKFKTKPYQTSVLESISVGIIKVMMMTNAVAICARGKG